MPKSKMRKNKKPEKDIANDVSKDTPKSITAIFSKHFGKKYGISLKLQDNKEPHEPINFDS